MPDTLSITLGAAAALCPILLMVFATMTAAWIALAFLWGFVIGGYVFYEMGARWGAYRYGWHR